jgi:hypothetical protein
MPVTKFRSIEEQRSALPPNPATDLWAAFAVSALCHQLRPWLTPRGVFRNRSLEEAQERRRAWEAGG